MGNFSRDSFRETNALINLLQLTGAPVADTRHYVGVRLQQGVPLLDADWNELEDLRRMELLALAHFFVGTGVPAGNQGFRILAMPDPNNFSIAAGVMLVEGSLVINPALTSYTGQPNAAGLPALTAPGANRADLVYLDIWEEEVNGVDGDSRLVNDSIGVETAVRLERMWAVRVEPNATSLAAVVKDAGHRYTALARLNRQAVATINADMIVDLRRTGITLAENLKVPLFMQTILETIDLPRFTNMLSGLRTSLFARLSGGQLPHQTANVTDENILLISLQEVMNRAHIGEVQTASRNMDNQDALAFMAGLHAVQKNFLTVYADIGNSNNAVITQEFITDYTKRLDGSAPDLIKGLKPAVDNQDLVAAVVAQEVINNFLASAVGNLPSGSVLLIYKGAIPFQPVTVVGAPYDFTFTIKSGITLPAADSEDFNVEATMSAPSWTVVPAQSTVSVQNQGGERDVVLRVTPGAEAASTMTVTVRAARNPLILNSPPGLALQINSLPPAATFLLYSGPRFNSQGQLQIEQAIISVAPGAPVSFSLINSTAQERTYTLTHFVTLDGGASTVGWTPLQSAPVSQVLILASGLPQPTQRFLRVRAPAGVLPGVSGVINVTAQVTAVDGVPTAGGESVTLQVPFIVII